MAGIDKIHWTKWRYQREGGKIGLKGEAILIRYPDIRMLGDEGLTFKEVDKSLHGVKNHVYVTYDRGYVIRFMVKKVAQPLVREGLSKQVFLELAGEAWDEAKKELGLTLDLEEVRDWARDWRKQKVAERERKPRLRRENPEEWRRERDENRRKGMERAAAEREKKERGEIVSERAEGISENDLEGNLIESEKVFYRRKNNEF